MIKVLLENVYQIDGTLDLQINLCNYLIKWCSEENNKIIFLLQRIEIQLAKLLLLKKSYKDALELVERLLADVRKVDDKHLIVEITLLESRIHHALENTAKAKASLTAGKACANSIYCPPTLQTEIDFQSGLLHSEDKDFSTAYSTS